MKPNLEFIERLFTRGKQSLMRTLGQQRGTGSEDAMSSIVSKIRALPTRGQAEELLRSVFGDEPPFVPNGHFYSPVQTRKELQRDIERIYPVHPAKPLDIDLNEAGQLKLLKELAKYLVDLPFEETPRKLRYGFNNPNYGYGDAATLVAMLRYLRPKRFIEIGSGHSSCVTVDTNELWLQNKMQCTFIEPYPDLLFSLLKPEDSENIVVHPKRIQDINSDAFRLLESGDVLFIDSTHVSKIGSDVNRIYFDILPLLKSGVYIHIHDVFYPFEYPKEWVLDVGRAWNEQYILRALLQNSRAYEIIHFTSYLYQHHLHSLNKYAPQLATWPGGNIWLRKT